MKIKDTLDLCGWGLHNFCIQNHDDLETLQNLGLGRKIFYTGNSNDKHHREVIYDGSTWRVSAYMSDVEGVQGNLSALTERVNAFLDGEVNSNEVLDNLKEIQAFLDAYPEATSLVQILDTKLDKTGGTITGTITMPYNHQIQWNDDSIMLYGSSDGFLYVRAPKGMKFVDGNTLLHEGNFASLITGTLGVDITGNAATADMLAKSYNENINYSQGAVGLKLIRDWSENGASLGFATKYQAGLSVVTDYVGWQMTTGGGSAENPYFRSMQDNGVWKPWRQIAFLTDNVASAQALIHSNGTVGATVDDKGRILTSGYGVCEKNENWQLSTAGYIGNVQGTISDGVELRSPKGIVLATNKIGLLINTSGNVTIGSQDNAGSDYKLCVNGETRIGNNIYVSHQSLYRSYLSDDTKHTLIGISPNDEILINSGDTVPTIIRGGNVLIGTTTDNGSNAKLHVNGAINITDNYKIGGLDVLRVKTDHLAIGEETAYYSSLPTKIYGTRITLQYGKDKIGGFFLNESGNVTIGDKDYAGSDYKLHVKGDLYVEGNIIATKEVSAGGAGTEGNGGAGGFSLYESWGTSAPTEPLALGANLGYELKTRVEDLELAKTKVTFEPALVSGKQIGTIEIDGNKTNLFAPATYAWSEIDGRPTSLSQFTDDVVSGKYLPLSGGTINGYLYIGSAENTSYYPIVLRRYGKLADFANSGDAAVVAFSDGESVGSLRITTNNITFNNNDILHSGNVGDYALKTDGSNAMKAPLHLYYSAIDKYDGTFVCQSNLAGGAPFDYASVVNIEDERFSSMQLAWYRNLGKPMLSFRLSENGTFSAWKTIAFTDSDITGNAATATKLATPRTIWGQSFDGTGNVSGTLSGVNNIYMNEGYRFYIGGVDSLYLYPSQKTIYIGYGAGTTYATAIAGNEVSLRYGGLNTGFILNSSGNVTIGNQDYAGTSARLYVRGTAHVSDVSYLTNVEIRNINDENYVASLYMSAKGFHIQSRHEGVAYINTILNQSGGNVLIGTTNDNGSGALLQVAGGASVSSLAVTSTSTFGGQSTFNAQSVFNAPVIIKDKNTLQIGDAVLMWDKEKKVLTVDKSFASMGEISSGGAGTEGGNTGGGGTGTITNPDVEYYNPKDNATHTFYHNLPYYDVVVQVYEKNAISGAWDMILADVTIANESNLVTVNFGRKEDVEHKIVVR